MRRIKPQGRFVYTYLPNALLLNKIPRLYATEDVPAKDKVIHIHFFLGNSDWYIAEFDVDG